MDFGISTQFFRSEPLTPAMLERLRAAGYLRFELFCNRPHVDFHDRSVLKAIVQWFQDNEVPPPSLHLPFMENIARGEIRWISILDSEKTGRERAIDEVKRCLELADRMPVAYVVLHLGVPDQKFSPVHFDYAYAAIERIRGFAGVRVMLENIPNEVSTLSRIREFISVSELHEVGICYDTGHGHLQGAADNLEGILTTHIHDNHGSRDEHLWPFQGTLDWPRLVEKLVVSRYTGPFVFETRYTDPDGLQKGAEVRGRLQELWSEATESIEEFRLKHKLRADSEKRKGI